MTGTEVKELKKEVKKYIDHADINVVKAVHVMLEAAQKGDWWNDISDGERTAIETGLQQAKAGKTTPHEKIREKHNKWLTK